GPEDLVRVPGTPWVVVSATQGGPMRIVNTRDLSTRVAFPLPNSQPRFDAGTYRSCPGPWEPPAGARSISHGINVRRGQQGVHTLYAIHHGYRETVEVYQVDARAETPAFTWIGCIPAPTGVVFNGVAPLPDGGLAATQTFRSGVAEIPTALAGK